MDKQKPEQEQVIPITASDLQAMLKAVLEEARKPVVTDEMKRQMAQEQEMRKRESAARQREREAIANLQKACSHLRPNGATRTVYVDVGDDQFLMCLQCRKMIRPKGEEIDLYNRHFQLSRSGIFG